MVATQQLKASKASAAVNQNQSHAAAPNAKQPAEPVSPSTTDNGEGEDEEDEDDFMPITPPTSEDAVPVTSKATSQKASAKPTPAAKPAAKPAASRKQSPEGVKKAPAVKNAKGEGAKADVKSSNNTKDGQGNSVPANKAGPAKPTTTQTESAKDGCFTKVDVQSSYNMDPA